MRKCIGAMGIAVALGFFMGSVMASPAAAVIKCYRVDESKGNWLGTTPGNVECKEKTEALKGTWVEAELIVELRPGLWCAKIFPVNSKTGKYENGTCRREEADGEYTTVWAEGNCGGGAAPGGPRARLESWLAAWPSGLSGFMEEILA